MQFLDLSYFSMLNCKAPITHSRIGSRMSYESWVGVSRSRVWMVRVNRSKFVVSRDESWWFLADRELAPKTFKSLKFWGRAPNQADSAWFVVSSVAESGETGARSGWFVALSRGSLVAHSWFTRATGEKYARWWFGGQSGQSRGGVGGGVGAIRSTIGYIGAESWHILV